MLKSKIIEENPNYVIFESFEGNSFLYERAYNSIHRNNANNYKLRKELDYYKIKTKFIFNSEEIDSKLSNSLDTLILTATENCNLRCDYCIFSGIYDGERNHSYKKMNFDIAREAINLFLKCSKNECFISFYGGEPLLNLDLLKDLVSYVNQINKDKKINFGLTTNFTLGKKNLDFLVKNNFIINVSLDGPKAIHDRWRKTENGKGSFDQIYKTLEKLFLESPDFYKKNISFSSTLVEPSKILEQWQFFTQKLFKSNIVMPQPLEKRFLNKYFKSHSKNNIKQGEFGLRKLVNTYINNIINNVKNDGFLKGMFDLIVSTIYLRSKEHIPNELWPRGTCIPGVRKLFINPEGEMYMCEKISSKLKIGDVNSGLDKYTIKSILKKYFDIKNKLCNDCWAIRLCDSCSVTAKDLTDSISFDSQKEMCNTLKEKLINGFGIYIDLVLNDKNENYINYLNSIK